MLCFVNAALAETATEIIVVKGASGTEEYGEEFSTWTQHWQRVAQESGTSIEVVGESSTTNDRDRLKSLVETSSTASDSPLWLILIGHGTYARGTAKFNLRGPDVSAKELSQWLSAQKRPLVVVNCASSSAPFINALSGPGRIIVSATKSGTEQNYARFGKYFSEAILSPKSDLDHDDAVSVQEAFLRASADVQAFYDNEARISTEHALIDDNGDGRGTPAKMFRGVRAIASAKDGSALDGKLAARITLAPTENQLPLTPQQSQRRDELEQQLDQWREQKSQLDHDQYQAKIEPVMIELAQIYQAAERKADRPGDKSAE
tara:strand:+ start:98833 stop:99789 length:957 start_codon:yes stop_codon:yes gene_type:complete